MDESMQAATRGLITSVMFFPSGLVRVYFGAVCEEWKQVDDCWVPGGAIIVSHVDDVSAKVEKETHFDQCRFNDLLDEIKRRGYLVKNYDARGGYSDYPRITFEIVQMPVAELLREGGET